MTIDDILKNRVVPFELEDSKLKSLFSFFLHKAPSIDSRSAIAMPSIGANAIWIDYLTDIKMGKDSYHVYSPGNLNDKNLDKYGLDASSIVKRNSKHMMCCYKNGESIELLCILRHIRNSIAHSNVFVLEKGRKYIIFDDYNDKENLTARILLSQTDLSRLRLLLEHR